MGNGSECPQCGQYTEQLIECEQCGKLGCIEECCQPGCICAECDDENMFGEAYAVDHEN